MLAARLIVSSTLVLAFPASAAEMTFELSGNGGNCSGCEWVAAQGEITPETPNVFRRFVTENGNPHSITLHSEGGNLFAGIELGKLIRGSGASTSIGETYSMTGELSHNEETRPGACLSACAFAFMGGVERNLGPDDVLGVHQFYSLSPEDMGSEVVQMLVGMTLLHTLDMGIDPAVVVAASATGSDRMYVFSDEEAIRLGLDTSTSFADPWRLEPYKRGIVLTTTYHQSVRQAVDVTLFCRGDGSTMYILASQLSPFYATQFGEGDKILELRGPYRSLPFVEIGGRKTELSESDIDFQRIDRERFYVSVRLPEVTEVHAQATLTFDPDLPRVYGPLLSASVNLPSWDWLSAMRKNCI